MDETILDMPLPHDEQLERAVIGGIILEPSVADTVINILKPEDFYNEKNRILYETVIEIISEGIALDPLTLKTRLEKKNKFEHVGGDIYLSLVMSDAAPPKTIEHIAQSLKEKAITRGLIIVAKDILLKAKQIKNVDELIDYAESSIFKLSEEKTISEYFHIGDVLQKTLEMINELSKKDSIVTGLPSGFYELDRLTTGFHKGDLIIVAARPAMGKTSFALSILHYVSVVENIPSAFFSLEMSKEQIAMRLLCNEARIPLRKVRSGFLTKEELEQITEKVLEMKNSPIYIDDTAALSILDLRAKARKLKREKDIQLIVVDYLQLMRSSRRVENRQQEVAEISRGLKGLAKDLDIPVIALAQLSRQTEMRSDKRPQLADLRESGCLTGDTLVIDADTGNLQPIEKLVGKQFYTLALDKDFKLKRAFVSKVFYSGKKKVYLLKTRTGREIKASSNHPFLKLDGWHRLDELKVGDKIAVPRVLKTGYKDDISDEEIILLAHLIGDGCILPRQPYHYTSADLQNINIVADTAEKLFNIKPRIVKQKNWYYVYLPSPYKLTKGKKHPITIWFEKLNIKRTRSYEKEVPEKIFNLSPKKIALFLKHLWATDGSISYRKQKGKFNISIYYSTTSKKLAHQIQHLLLKLGIISIIRTTKKENYRPSYNIYITGKTNQKKFLTKVGCFGSRGETIPEVLKILEDIKENPNIDIIPKEIWNLYIKQLLHISHRQFAKALGISYCGSSLFKNSLSRERLNKIANILNAKILYDLASSDVLWDEIIEIKELGVEDVYDMTVENYHNFVANDFIVHNSIEQDADMVMFIHRPEYYKKNPTPEEKGIAEIIIAKQRNGPTGTIKLAFIKEITKFENLAKDYFQSLDDGEPPIDQQEDENLNYNNETQNQEVDYDIDPEQFELMEDEGLEF